MLREQAGHDFFGYKQDPVIRRIEQRMMVHRITSEQEYVSFLEHHPEELARLHGEIPIGVTRFFRNKGAFEALNRLVLGKFLEGDPSTDQALRFWVVGCSTGEEVYSLAILAQERIEACRRQPGLTIFATDIRPEALAGARRGTFPSNIDQSVAKVRLDRFFVPHHGGYKVKPSIRKRIIFAEHSIIRDIPFSHLDLVTCRNLLIYLQPEVQTRVLEIIHYSLKPNGFLFLGQCDSVGVHEHLFRRVDRKCNIYQRVGDDPVSETREAAESYRYVSRRQRNIDGLELTMADVPLAEISDNTTIGRLKGDCEKARFRNEELQSANEELLVRNEELETSRDELHSSAQELQNRCSALQAELDGASSMNTELECLFRSLDIAMVFLDARMQIVRFTQAANRIIRLIPADTGRSIEDLGIRLRMARSELLSLIRAVIIDLKTYQRDVWHQDGGCYSMTIKPFRRCDNRIEGAVLVFVDITAQQRSIW